MADCISPSPEMNSASRLAASSAEPLFIAAAAWEDLAADLEESASSFGEVISMALESEQGSDRDSTPVSRALSTAAESYMHWLNRGATEALQSAQDARAAASVLGAADTGGLLPTAMAANRQMAAALVETNFFGQNAAAIGCIEGIYAEMWAQDLERRSNHEASDRTTTSTPKPTSPLMVNPPIELRDSTRWARDGL
jgi:PPE-repeat protein